jgi:hypothetical protein
VGQVMQVGWVGDDSHVYGKKILGENGSMRRLLVVMQQPVLLSPVSMDVRPALNGACYLRTSGLSLNNTVLQPRRI